jgi:hypothetical protein
VLNRTDDSEPVLDDTSLLTNTIAGLDRLLWPGKLLALQFSQ